NNLINTDLSWIIPDKKENSAHVLFDTKLAKTNDGALTAYTYIKPTQVVIFDSLWNVGASSVEWSENKKLIINNFTIKNNEQSLAIDGEASNSADDKINVNLHRLDLEGILNIVGLKGIDFGGMTSGKIEVSNTFSKPIFIANLSVDGATMNQMPIGNAKLFSTYNENANSIVIDGIFIKQNIDTLIVAKGNYFIKNDSLDLSFNARGVGISFLNQYFQDVVNNVDGQGFGKLRLFGKTKNLGFKGDIFVKEGTATVALLNTTYTFNDTVYLRPKNLSVKNLRLFDNEKNQAVASGQMQHTGMFQHPVFDFKIQATNLLSLNTQSGNNEYFFGKIYADGTVQIKGNERIANFTVNAVSKPRSKLYIRMQNTYTATDNGFISFVNHNEKTDSQAVETPKNPDFQMLTHVIMQVEVTPDAEVELIVDPKSGDLINAKGAGDLRLDFDSRSSDMKLFGTYTISNGYYLFSIQDIIRKEFEIENGSSIAWSGDMRNANVNIRGIYSLSAYLRDLLDANDSENKRATVPVNCVLHLTDNLMSPTITLDLELPQSDATLQQIVKNVVNTQEMMNREIVSLLLMGRFYKPEYLNSANNQANTGNEALSFAAATLSGLISRISQSSNFSVGFGVNATEQNQEYTATINYKINDRIVINGNIGYQNDVAYNNSASRFIRDFDFEYKLTSNGKLLFRAYNHTVDRLGSPKESQGLGFAYREDFNSVSDMMNFYLKKLTGIFKTKKKK
ncbi:MAG: translocation/assembly module TamB, partial [Paludibacter sp.]|nr:translocation/assembly module TamB [Paludibacter sp.]